MARQAIDNGFILGAGQKENDKIRKGQEKGSDLTLFEFPTMLVKNVYEAIKMNRKTKYSQLADNLGVSEATIKRAISDLKDLGFINAEHSKIRGEWQLMK